MSKSHTLARKPQQLCVVAIGIDYFVMPMADGVRLVEIMGRAAPVERQYLSPRDRYVLREDRDTRVELAAVRADQIIAPPTRSSPRRGGMKLITNGEAS